MSIEYFGLGAKQLKSARGALCAEATLESGKKNYYIAFINSGVEAGFMVNPQSVYYNETILTGHDKLRDKPMIELREASSDAFACYYKFLETGNVSYFHNAKRS